MVILIISRKDGDHLKWESKAEMLQNRKRMATATDYREEGARIRTLTETIENERDLCVMREAAELCDVLADRAEIAVNVAAN